MVLYEMKRGQIVCMKDGQKVWSEMVTSFLGPARQLAECIESADPFVSAEESKEIDPSLLSGNVDKSFAFTFGR